MRGLIGHRPDDHVRPVLVTGDHIRQLGLGIRIRIRILPMNGPVDRNLGPYEQTHLLGQAYHGLIVRIMCQTHEIASHLACPSKQYAILVFGKCPAALAVRHFLVNGHSPAENLLPVQQNVRTGSLYGPESHPVIHGIRLGSDCHIVEFRILRAPVLRFRLEFERSIAVSVSSHSLRNLQFGNRDSHFL